MMFWIFVLNERNLRLEPMMTPSGKVTRVDNKNLDPAW